MAESISGIGMLRISPTFSGAIENTGQREKEMRERRKKSFLGNENSEIEAAKSA